MLCNDLFPTSTMYSYMMPTNDYLALAYYSFRKFSQIILLEIQEHQCSPATSKDRYCSFFLELLCWRLTNVFPKSLFFSGVDTLLMVDSVWFLADFLAFTIASFCSSLTHVKSSHLSAGHFVSIKCFFFRNLTALYFLVTLVSTA